MTRFLGLVGACLLLAACGGTFQPTHTEVLRLDDRDGVGQTFVADGPLREIDLLVATYGATPTRGRLRVRVRDEDEIVATGFVDADALRDNTWVRVPFDDPVALGAEAAFVISWSGEEPLGVYANTPPGGACPAGPAATRLCNDPYAEGHLLRDGVPADGDLAFRTVVDGGGLAR